MVEMVRVACCGQGWVGADRAHCCGRFGGCGAVFDDAALWDAHRPSGACLDPRTLGLAQTKNGIWRPVAPASEDHAHRAGQG